MYGRIFESLYRGSMIGAGAMVFAVWSYVLTYMREDSQVGAQVELNPKLLGAIIGEKQEDIEKAIEYLCAPDPESTSKDEDGKRLIRMGQFAYRVVNGKKYIDIRNAEDRRAYQRTWIKAKRAGVVKKGKPAPGEVQNEKAVREGWVDEHGRPVKPPESQCSQGRAGREDTPNSARKGH